MVGAIDLVVLVVGREIDSVFSTPRPGGNSEVLVLGGNSFFSVVGRAGDSVFSIVRIGLVVSTMGSVVDRVISTMGGVFDWVV